jgi:N-methylhydantoinase A/oxoprolinase/acetone carboxylase beta subunit
MPDVVAVGIGGGTIVRLNNNTCKLGPDSVGYKLKEKAIAFGGDTLTLSDFSLATNQLQIEGALAIEDLKNKIQTLSGKNFSDALELVKEQIQLAIERLVDKLKTDYKEVPVIACGGGAFLLPKKIEGASNVIFPEHLEVANAFGACIAQISREEELVINTLQKNEKEELELLVSKAKAALLKNGASENSINILTKESIPLAYLPGAVKLKVKLCGDLQTDF